MQVQTVYMFIGHTSYACDLWFVGLFSVFFTCEQHVWGNWFYHCTGIGTVIMNVLTCFLPFISCICEPLYILVQASGIASSWHLGYDLCCVSS